MTEYKIESANVTAGMISLDPSNTDRQAIIPAREVAWWEELIESGVIVLHLRSGGAIRVRFTLADGGEAYAELQMGLWDALALR